jgi:hypothetical protein
MSQRNKKCHPVVFTVQAKLLEQIITLHNPHFAIPELWRKRAADKNRREGCLHLQQALMGKGWAAISLFVHHHRFGGRK